MYSVVITAAGSGTRANLGYNKMLYKIDGITLIEKAVQVFANNSKFNQIIVTASQTDLAEYKQILSKYDVELIVGGKERMDSVANGINAATNETVYVHDGARVFLDDNLLQRLFSFTNSFDGLSLALAVTDTTLQVIDGKISEVLDRSTLFNMQTPQVVNRQVYINCYEQAIANGQLFTDEMSMLCAYGYNCQIVESESYNIKLTKPEDFKG